MTLLIEEVSFSYAGSDREVLDAVSVWVEPGEVVGLGGPSGCGKSTLGRLACGMLLPGAGRVEVDGATARPRRGPRPVQLVHQDPFRAMNPRWTVRSVLEEADPAASARDGVVGWLVDPGWLDRYPHEISGGELQRVSLARALLARPAYLVADEISASLDPITQAELWRDLLAVVAERRIGVLAISHDTALLDQVADRTLMLPSPWVADVSMDR